MRQEAKSSNGPETVVETKREQHGAYNIFPTNWSTRRRTTERKARRSCGECPQRHVRLLRRSAAVIDASRRGSSQEGPYILWPAVNDATVYRNIPELLLVNHRLQCGGQVYFRPDVAQRSYRRHTTNSDEESDDCRRLQTCQHHASFPIGMSTTEVIKHDHVTY